VWLKFYNDERKHQVLGHKTPSQVFAVTENNDVQAYGYDEQNKNVLPTSLQAQQQPKEKDSKHERKVISLDNELLAA